MDRGASFDRLLLEDFESFYSTLERDDPDRIPLLSHYASLKLDQFKQTGRMVDLDEAICHAEQATVETTTGDPDQAKRLSVLGNMLATKFERTKRMADLDGAILYAKQAVDVPCDDDRDSAAWLNNLGIKLKRRFEQKGDFKDLDGAIENVRKGTELAPRGYYNLAPMFSDLSNMFGTKSEHTQNSDDSDKAILYARKAVDSSPKDHPDLTSWLNNLGSLLAMRFQRTGSNEDLDEAILNTEKAVKAVSVGNPNRGLMLSNLGRMFEYRHKQTKSTEDLEKVRERLSEMALHQPSTTGFFDPHVKAPLQRRLKTHHVGAKEIVTNLSSWEALVSSYIEREMPSKQEVGWTTDDISQLDSSLWESPQVDDALYSPLEPRHRTFRLITLLPGTKNDDIECLLGTWVLDRAPTYYALSYTWGEASNKHHITINKHEIQITVNLDSALRHLRKPSNAIRFWIDAICINQADIKERSEQVRLMRDIYVYASKVIVWLGPASPNSGRALDLIRRLSRDYVYERICYTGHEKEMSLLEMRSVCESRPIAAGHAQPSLSSPYDNDAWEGVIELLSRPWFMRAWTLQEIVVASKASICCGEEEVDWRVLITAALLMGIHNRFQGSTSPNRPRQLDLTNYHQVVEVYHAHQKFAAGENIDLFYLLYTSWHRKATDPRDKIYAHLGLVKELDLEIDYSLPVAEVYTGFAKSVILSFRSIDILRGKRSAESEHDVPSWVPDWTVESHQNFPSDVKYLTAGNSRALPEFLDKRSVVLQGLVLDLVEHVGPVPIHNAPVPAEFWYEWECIAYGLLDIKDCRGSVMNVLGKDILLSKCQEPYIGGGTMLEAFARTQIGDRFIDGSDEVPSVKVGRIWEAIEGRRDPPPTFGQQEQPARGMDHYIGRFRQSQAQAIRGRSIFTTTKGYMGLCLPTAEAGDLVCILLGGSVPFVLRPGIGHYTFIGEAYVHGIMDGEAIRDVDACEFEDFIVT